MKVTNQQAGSEPMPWRLFKQALYVGMERDCMQYLMANAKGRRDGVLKASKHESLCRHIVAAVRGCDPDYVRLHHENDYQAVHTGTQALTDRLDESIGFPLYERPDYEELTPKFFSQFFALAMAALGIAPVASVQLVAVPSDWRDTIEQAAESLDDNNCLELAHQLRAILAVE